MSITEVTIVRRCARCRHEVGVITVKKDNMRLMAAERIWCEKCGAEAPEVREIAGREAAIAAEQAAYPANPPVADVSAAEFRRRRSTGSAGHAGSARPAATD